MPTSWIHESLKFFSELELLYIALKLESSGKFTRGRGTQRVWFYAIGRYANTERWNLHFYRHSIWCITAPHPSKVVVANVENNHHKLKEHEILKMALNINIEGPQIGSPGSGNEQTRRSICTVTCSNMSFPDSMKNFDRWTKRFFRCIVNHSLLAVYDGHPKTYLKWLLYLL